MDKDTITLLAIILIYYSLLFLYEQYANHENLESCWQACNNIPSSTTTPQNPNRLCTKTQTTALHCAESFNTTTDKQKQDDQTT